MQQKSQLLFTCVTEIDRQVYKMHKSLSSLWGYKENVPMSKLLSNCLIWDFYMAGTGERWETN